jgi:hypothetical protein
MNGEGLEKLWDASPRGFKSLFLSLRRSEALLIGASDTRRTELSMLGGSSCGVSEMATDVHDIEISRVLVDVEVDP